MVSDRMMSAQPSPVLPDVDDIEEAVRAQGLGVGACELHGALCGWLAGGGADSPRWLAQVLADDSLPAPGAGSPLDRLRTASVAQMEDREFDFDLLMPDADASLEVRSSGLFDWCRGFLGGFGLAAGAKPPLSEESLEALTDLAKLAAASPQEDGDEDDEAALAEIEEFVRVAALLLHGDCAMAARHRRQLH
ncbi:YecA family protein [Lysobacter hankyongensis]|uniref:YecA family protein n=2 Tax=Lysobacter hankyongensis TaxID=1176535 RepID=A0ABP9C706_9GAMM